MTLAEARLWLSQREDAYGATEVDNALYAVGVPEHRSHAPTEDRACCFPCTHCGESTCADTFLRFSEEDRARFAAAADIYLNIPASST